MLQKAGCDEVGQLHCCAGQVVGSRNLNQNLTAVGETVTRWASCISAPGQGCRTAETQILQPRCSVSKALTSVGEAVTRWASAPTPHRCRMGSLLLPAQYATPAWQTRCQDAALQAVSRRATFLLHTAKP